MNGGAAGRGGADGADCRGAAEVAATGAWAGGGGAGGAAGFTGLAGAAGATDLGAGAKVLAGVGLAGGTGAAGATAKSDVDPESREIVITPPHTEQRARTLSAGSLSGSTRKTERHSGQTTFMPSLPSTRQLPGR